MPARPIVIALDIEPAERHTAVPGSAGDWSGFSEVVGALDDLRPRIVATTGAPAHVSWYLRMDAQIELSYGSYDWPARYFQDTIERLGATGDEFGLHPHFYRWDYTRGAWWVEQADQKWVNEVVSRAHIAYTNALGREPTSIRFGDRWLNNDTVALVERLGFRYELTLEPGKEEARATLPDTGALPDSRRMPREPYRPSLSDFRRRGRLRRRDIWVLPTATGCSSRRPLPHRDHRGHQVEALNLALDTGFIQPLIDFELAQRGGILQIVGRTGDLGNPIFGPNFLTNLEYLASHRGLSGHAVVTPAEAMALFHHGKRRAV